MFYWSGKPSGEQREVEAAFAISNQLVKELQSLPTGYHSEFTSVKEDT